MVDSKDGKLEVVRAGLEVCKENLKRDDRQCAFQSIFGGACKQININQPFEKEYVWFPGRGRVLELEPGRMAWTQLRRVRRT